MSNWIITYKGTEYSFPNFTSTLENTLPIVPRNEDSPVLQADLEKSCPVTGHRMDKMDGDEKTQFTNLLLNERGIFGTHGSGYSGTSWGQFKNSIAQITQAFQQSILSADFTDIESNCDEIISWLTQIQELTIVNIEKITIFLTNDQLGCGNGRCREKACHTTEFWTPTLAGQQSFLVQVVQQIEYVNEVKGTIGSIEDGSLPVDDLVTVVRENKERVEEQEAEELTQERIRKLMIAGAIVGALFLLIFIIRKIKNR